MKETTLCYIEDETRKKYLMLHRNKKKNDENEDKWIGVGGKLERGETPEECLLREVTEETGLTLTEYRYRGVVDFSSDCWGEERMHLFTAASFIGKLRDDCEEGELVWLDKTALAGKKLWEGDKLFLSLLEADADFFKLTLVYHGEKLIEASLNGEKVF